MGLPSKRRTNRSKRDRSSHFALTKTDFKKCTACGAMSLPHQACKACGNYKGKAVVNKEKRVIRLAKKTTAKA